MHEIKANVEKNQLVIRLVGEIDKNAAETAQQTLINEVGKLKPGFVVLNDISDLRYGHLPAFDVLKDIVLFLKAQQAGKIIRIVGQAKTSKAQFEHVAQDLDDYEPIIVESIREAEEILAQSPGPAG